MLLAIALLAAQAESGTGKATRLRPATPPGSWITDDDYPPSAMRAGHQGTVSFRMEISTDGLPVGCSVTQSSGFDDLDQQACALLQRRARFTPARDHAGHAIPASYSGRFTWRMSSATGGPATDHYSRLDIELSAAGDAVRCNLHDAELPQHITSCSGFANGVPVGLLGFAGGEGHRRVIVIETAIAVKAGIPKLQYAETGHVQRSYVRRAITFDGAGVMTGCKAEAQIGGDGAPITPVPCDDPPLAAPLGADGKPEAVTVTVVSAVSRVDL